MNRIGVINALVEKYGLRSYLEIGVGRGKTFGAVRCPRKVGVDPDPAAGATCTMTSEEFFETNGERFDIVLIDGLHHHAQAYRDILNALSSLNDGGFVVMHDCNPRTRERQLTPRPGPGAWNGDAWKAFVRARALGREMFVIDCDHGVGVIAPGVVEPYLSQGELSWENLQARRRELLNLISPADFRSWLCRQPLPSNGRRGESI